MNIKHLGCFVISLLFMLLLPGCSKEKSNFKLINVLSKELYDDVHIAGSENVEFEDLEKKLENEWKKLDKKTTFVFYCSNYSCSASGEAALLLERAGFNNAYAYEGGMAEWYNLNKQDKTYKIIGHGTQRYLTRPNPVKPAAPDLKVVTAEQLKKMIQDHHVKGW